jgi:hypothetical protein
MRRTAGLVLSFAALAGVGLTACPKPDKVTTTPPSAPRHSFNASAIRSFTDTYAVSTLVDTSTNLFVGSTRGLVRWDAANMKYSVITTKDGLPADRITAVTVDKSGAVWVATPAGVAHAAARGPWQKAPAAPVGDFLAAILPSGDGQSMWAGGPEGLARLPAAPSPALTPIWTRTLSDVTVTAMLLADGGAIWIGTAGRGVLRIAPDGETIESYGAREGCEVDVVRGMALLDKGLLVVGEGPSGPRVGYWDPGLDRFFSYALEAPRPGAQPPVLGFAARGAGHTYVGLGQGAVAEVVISVADKDGKWSVPEPADTPLRLVARPTAPTPAPRRVPLKADLPSTALDEPTAAAGAPTASAPPAGATPTPAPTPSPSPAPAAPVAEKKKDKKSPPAAAPSGPPAPRLVVLTTDFRLPEGVTATASSERGLLVGTRFLGALRIENGVPRHFRTHDLTAGAERLTVACQGDDCYLATGTARAWRFDGQSFEIAPIDPEPGSRVLAVLADPRGGALAIHRGAKDSILRLSTVADKRWTPVGIQTVLVPYGPPELNFAVFAPSGALWVGLRYFDRESDPVDFGAAEIALESGQVIYHNQSGPPPRPSSSGKSRRGSNASAPPPATGPAATVGTTLPNDMVAMYWRGASEAWFATRSGAAQMLDNKVTLFTEADGMESELIRDIGPGPHSPLEEPTEIWVATGRGTGKWDGRRWTFPKMGPYYLKANGLTYDGKGHVFLGTEKGVYCVGDCDPDAIDERRGLIENAVLDLTVDTRGRVWVLTPKGVSIIDP